MVDALSELELLHEIQTESDAIGRLLSAKGGFEAAFKAFREADSKSFRSVLDRAALLIRCHYVCRWIRIKECVFLCLDLAGPPTHFERPPDPRVLATALGRLGADEKLVKRLADILVKRNRQGFLDVVKKLEIQPFAHFFCHWLCTIRYRLVCRRICTIDPPPYVLWAEIQAAAMAVGALAEDGRTFKAVAAASVVGDAAKLADLLRHPDWTWRCHYVCEYFCSWRCVLLCLTYSRPFPYAAVAAAAQIREARAFAEVIAKLSENSAALEQLTAAVASGKVDRWTAIVKELKLERFALQLCHWVCGWRCRWFCRLVCPDPQLQPLFRAIGDFRIHTDIDPGTGLTNKQRWNLNVGLHGGPNYGFFGNLALRASCPLDDPANPGQKMSYRFLFQRPGDPNPIPITAGFVSEVYVGDRLILWKGFTKSQGVYIRGAGPTPTPTPPTPDIEPPDHYIVPDGQGWVEIDPQIWGYSFNGDLMGFATLAAIAGGDPAPGVVPTPGTPPPPANQKDGTDCAIFFQATRTLTKAAVNGGATPDYSDSISKVRINNWNEVSWLDLLQFQTGGGTPCSPLSNALDIEYTVDHELIAPDWDLDVSSASNKTLTAPPPPPSTPRGGAGTHHENIAAWPTCSYTVILSTRRRLTTGVIDDSTRDNTKTFCIGRRQP